MKDAPITVTHLDDDVYMLEKMAQALQNASGECSFKVTSADNEHDFFESLKAGKKPAIVILDVDLGKGKRTGIEILAQTRRIAPDTIILMCSNMDDVAMISACIQHGADDFIAKTDDPKGLHARVYSTYHLIKRRSAGAAAPVDTSGEIKPLGRTMQVISNRIPMIISSAITSVHIRGESGTGKELVAELFQKHMSQSTPFVKFNCGAITPSLLESELFGYVKGAFTGAAGDRRGLIEAAHGGWLFLDEIATIPIQTQISLLRVLENHVVRRVGSTEERKVNIRILSATNESIPELVRAGKFRLDLWQRLCEAEIVIPPLRERTDEIPEIVQQFCGQMPSGPYAITQSALDVLTAVSWKNGNVRELRNCLRAMTEQSIKKQLTPLSIPARVWEELEEGHEGGLAHEEPPVRTKMAAPGHEATSLTLQWNGGEMPGFETLAQILLLEMIRNEYRKNGEISLRSLAKSIGLARTTLSARVKNLVEAALVSSQELNDMFGKSEVDAES